MKVRKVKVLVAQSCPTLCDPMDCSPPGFPVHGILQARILEWIPISFSRGSSQTRGWTWVSYIAGTFFTFPFYWATFFFSFFFIYLFFFWIKKFQRFKKWDLIAWGGWGRLGLNGKSLLNQTFFLQNWKLFICKSLDLVVITITWSLHRPRPIRTFIWLVCIPVRIA